MSTTTRSSRPRSCHVRTHPRRRRSECVYRAATREPQHRVGESHVRQDPRRPGAGAGHFLTLHASGRVVPLTLRCTTGCSSLRHRRTVSLLVSSSARAQLWCAARVTPTTWCDEGSHSSSTTVSLGTSFFGGRSRGRLQASPPLQKDRRTFCTKSPPSQVACKRRATRRGSWRSSGPNPSTSTTRCACLSHAGDVCVR